MFSSDKLTSSNFTLSIQLAIIISTLITKSIQVLKDELPEHKTWAQLLECSICFLKLKGWVGGTNTADLACEGVLTYI